MIKRRKPIRKVSKGRARLNREYSRKKHEFLSRPENKFCPVIQKLTGEKILTEDIHHMRGRAGSLFMNEKYWLAVSRRGHELIGSNPNWARQHGFLCQKGLWNQPEK